MNFQQNIDIYHWAFLMQIKICQDSLNIVTFYKDFYYFIHIQMVLFKTKHHTNVAKIIKTGLKRNVQQDQLCDWSVFYWYIK